MKKTAVLLAGISSLLLFTASALPAAERKIIFNSERIKYESGTGARQCQAKCGRRSGPDARALLSAGWKIVSSSPKEVIAENYRYVPCNSCEPHGCTCFGTEYVLQRDPPAPGAEFPNNEQSAPDEVKQTMLHGKKADTANEGPGAPDKSKQGALRSETPCKELDLLKKENELLKQENTFLKRENEILRKQIESKR
jgi:hypothetical protein